MTIIANPWMIVRMRLRLKLHSEGLWMEFTGFRRMITWQIIKEMNRAPTANEAKTWIFRKMEEIDHKIKARGTTHEYPSTLPVQWMSNYLPQLNQSILLATAEPAVIADMSTVADCQFRRPMQWANFGQFRLNLSVECTPLPPIHPTLLN